MVIRNGQCRNRDRRIGELVVTKRKSVRLDDIARVLLVLWNSHTSAKKWSPERPTAYQVQRKNKALQVLLLQRMENTLLQIVQEEVAFGRKPTTDSLKLEMRNSTTIGGLRGARGAFRISHDETC